MEKQGQEADIWNGVLSLGFDFYNNWPWLGEGCYGGFSFRIFIRSLVYTKRHGKVLEGLFARHGRDPIGGLAYKALVWERAWDGWMGTLAT